MHFGCVESTRSVGASARGIGLRKRGVGGAGPVLTAAFAACLAAWAAPLSVLGQEPNLDTFEQLGLRCLEDAPSTVDEFRLIAPETMPYLRAAVIETWLERGRRVTVDSVSAENVAVLRYAVVDANVGYRRLGRRLYEREISLSLEYTLTGADGGVRGDHVCNESAVDTLRTSDLTRFENRAFAETIGEKPPGGWMRRIVEPAVLIGAAAVGVFLFFSLRDGQG